MNNIYLKGSELKVGHVIEVEGLPALIKQIQKLDAAIFAPNTRGAALVPYGASGGYQGKAILLEPDLAYSVRIEEGPLRLYVWTEFSPSRTGGLAFALAYNEAHARSLIQADYGVTRISDWGDLKELPLDVPTVFQVSGGD